MEHLVKTGEDINSYTEKLKYGDVVKVEPGEYGGIKVSVPGIIYKSLELHKAIILGSIYFFPEASYVTIEGFDNRNPGHYYSLNMEKSGEAHNIVSKCLLTGVGYSGAGNIFERNEVHDSGHGFHPGGGPAPDGTLFLNNIIHDLVGHGIAAVGGINEKAIGNIIYNCKKSSSGGGTGIFFGTAGPQNVRVEKNLVWGCEAHEITVGGSNAVVIFNTAVTTNPNAGLTYYIESNNAIVKNNIGVRFGSGNQVVLMPRDVISDYNCWFNPDELKAISRYYDKMALEKYKTYGQGLHSISKDPKFADVLNQDFHLQPDSPCIGSGEKGVNMGYYQNGGGEMSRIIVGINFVGRKVTENSGEVRGKVTLEDGTDPSRVIVGLTGSKVVSTNPDANGDFAFTGLPDGSYNPDAVLEGYEFEYTGTVPLPIVIPSAV